MILGYASGHRRRDIPRGTVTHNMQQAARVSDYASLLTMRCEDRAGGLVEHGSARKLFTGPGDQRTEDDSTGRFG